MKPFTQQFISIVIALIVTACSVDVPSTITPSPAPSSTYTSIPAPTATNIPTSNLPATPTPIASDDEIRELRKLVSQDQLFAYVENLTSVQAYSGWRNSATEGEAEALDTIAGTLSELTHLQNLGLELERQSFHVYLGTEIWESRLFLSVNGQEMEVPANALSGHRKDLKQALRFDSDGALNDADRNPRKVAADAILVRSADEILNLADDEAQGKIVLLDFAAVDPEQADKGLGAQLVSALVQKDIAGLVLVTESGHSKYAGDGTIIEDPNLTEGIPMLTVRLEDLAAAGITSWEALAQIKAVRLIWDTDVFSPGQSGNLVARIPGLDASRAVILGAHIDSLNSPGAGDNALNCAALLELARVLDEAAFQPLVDVYLVWFGSEELGFYGSQHFVNTHQELLDRTLAAFLMDGFTADQPGPSIFGMQEAPHSRFGDTRLPFSDYLSQKAELFQIPIEIVYGSGEFASDDGPFYGFVPEVRFAFGSNRIGTRFHSPDDTLEIMQDQGEVMEQSVAMALIAAIGTPQDVPALRVTPEPERRALIVATHTEVLHMSPTLLIQLDRALAWEAFDVDVIPYGQALTSDDLAEAGLVLALPVMDYPTADGDLSLYDEAWQPDEIDLLAAYVERGGLLVLTNSANRLFFGEAADPNEDWEKVNALAAPFGIRYEGSPFANSIGRITGDHLLTENLTTIFLDTENSLPIRLQTGEALVEVAGQAALGLVDYGTAGGQVLVLSDLGMLQLFDFGQNERDSIALLRNLARFASER